jgi:UDP:flavonoid glycosyltransferase YjiC (YdhE family)
MNIAFLLIPEKGHLNPYIGPAQALIERGHTVTVLAPGDIAPQMAAAGLAFDPALIPAHAGERPTHGAALVELIQDEARLARWIEQLLLDGIDGQVETVRAALRRLAADIVVLDPLYYPAALAADAEGLPWASVSNSLNPVLPDDLDSALLRTTRALAPRRDALFAAYGCPARFRGCDVLSPFLNVAFTTEALCGPVPGVELVGPSFPLHSRGDEAPLRPLPSGRPLVYASFGSQIYHWPEIFAKLRAAAAAIGAGLVLSAGELAAGIPEDDATRVYPYAPQLTILKTAAAFVTHGGANSFMESAAAGVPMLLSPMCNDQFHQAHFLRRAGNGVVLDLRDAPVDAIAGALRRLLADESIRAAAARLAAAYRRDGARRTAELVERLRPC